MIIKDLLEKVLINQRLVIIDQKNLLLKQQHQWLKINVGHYSLLINKDGTLVGIIQKEI